MPAGRPVRSAAAGKPRSLDHATVHAWYCGRLAGQVGAVIAIADQPDVVTISCAIALADA